MDLDPSRYPWPEPPCGGRLTTSGLVDCPPEAADLEGRVPVVAVGSNASPLVLARKLGALLDRGVPVAVGTVDGLVVGHSAHVSARGYVAAAPARGDGRTAVTVGWFDEDQVGALDATEPNYHRVALPADIGRGLEVEGMGNVAVPTAQVYASVHGVVGERGRPLPLGDQASILEWISRRLSDIRGPLTHERLQDVALRERVRAGLVKAGLVVRAGLGAQGRGRTSCR